MTPTMAAAAMAAAILGIANQARVEELDHQVLAGAQLLGQVGLTQHPPAEEFLDLKLVCNHVAARVVLSLVHHGVVSAYD